MEITTMNAFVGVLSRSSLPNAERISTRVIESRDIDGDKQLSVEELGKQSGILKKVDSNGDSLVNQEELFSALSKKLEEKNNTSIEITLNINVIKANLGSLLSSVINRSESNTVTNLFTENGITANFNQSNSNVRERYINALITAGLNNSGIIGSSSNSSNNSALTNSINPFSTNQNNGNQLLLNLLVEELGTPEDDATAILKALQTESFQTIA